MERARVLDPWRAGVVAVVLVIHLTLIIAAALATRRGDSHSSAPDFVTTWVLLPARAAPAPPAESRAQLNSIRLIRAIPIETPEIQSLPIFSDDAAQAVDWVLESRKAVTAVLGAPKARQLGPSSKEDPLGAMQQLQAVHRAGEAYRDSGGNNEAWVDDSCYVLSESAPLGTPDVFARARPTRTICVDGRAPEGELFKDLEAYRKHHSP